MTRAVGALFWALAWATVGCAAAPARPVAAEGARDRADVIARSHDFVDAFAAADGARVEPLLAPGFVKIEASRFMERARLVARFAAHAAADYPRVVERTWQDDRLRFSGDVAVFTGFTRAKLVRAEGAAPTPLEQQLTLVWVRGSRGWQVALYQVSDAGVEAERQFWNEVYRESTGFETRPNRLLVETVKGRTPGRALDIAMGQGRNAVFLAGAGWEVTGVDISDEALRQAQENARQAGVSLTTLHEDVDTWDYGTDAWDLISFIYAGGGKTEVERVRRGLKPGGLLVVEFFLAASVKDIGISGFAPGELPALYKDGFKVLRYEEVEDQPDWGTSRAKLVRFVAQKL